ncbi:MAG: flagellar export chaperone FlgN [Treponema sp.]|jgi:hypothetical protein|nr:flagellar export chaperone FlgN [Treponema sp.]
MEADNNIVGTQHTFGTTGLADNERTFFILQLQTEIMEKIAAIQESVRNAVINRQWTDFESLLRTMNQYGDQFQELETERAALFAGFLEQEEIPAYPHDKDSKPDFYTVVSRLPEEERRGLTELYRNLKLRTLKVRMANDSLVSYLNEAKTTVDSFLDAACPDRKNRFYSRRGAKVPTDMRSMVINQSL